MYYLFKLSDFTSLSKFENRISCIKMRSLKLHELKMVLGIYIVDWTVENSLFLFFKKKQHDRSKILE